MSDMPLAGVHVLVTRSRAQASTLRQQLEALGACVSEVPVLAYVACADAVPPSLELLRNQTAVFTSVNGVQFTRALYGVDLTGIRCATVGSATADAARRAGCDVVCVATRTDAEGLLEVLVSEKAGSTFVWFHGEEARAVLADGLRRAGAALQEVVVYRAVADATAFATLEQRLRDGLDVVTFASSNTASAFDRLLPPARVAQVRALPTISIGTHTTAQLRALGYTQIIESREATIAGLVAAVVQHIGETRRGPGPEQEGS